MTIVVCEPQCCGFEHAQFNSALLATVLAAFPDARVVFLGDAAHAAFVASAVSVDVGPLPARLGFRHIPLDPPDLAHWGWFTLAGYRRDRARMRQVREALAREKADLLIFASLTNTGLFAWKAAQQFRPGTPTVAILHAVLGTLARAPRVERPILARRPRWWRDLGGLAIRLRLGPALSLLLTRALNLQRILMLPPATNIRYVALGPSIHRALRELDPALAARFDVLEVPSFVHGEGTDQPPRDGVRFGFLGVGYKGFASFARLAAAVRSRHADARFDLVGFLNTPEDPASYEGFVEGVGGTPLSRDEFEMRARAITYAIWTAEPARYRFTASASFVDALSFGKPGIYLRNPFVEDCFDRMGDIGYLCDSLDEVQEVVESILERFPAERYRAQQQAIVAGRAIFTPQAQAIRIREIAAKAGF